MRTDAIAVIRSLAERWLNTFFPEAKKREPLKVGIFEDLTAAAPDVNRKMLRLALRMYTATDSYLLACSKGHKRIDLNGNEVEEVSEKDKARAREILEVKKNNEKARADAQNGHPERPDNKEEAKRPVPKGVNARKPLLKLKV
jgi:ProP effector